ncbi:hypothetical protein PCK2_000762 [Pneumocystis canis]|nr:hypothetical protein PCK2_000762 [Pneumocystis canis]
MFLKRGKEMTSLKVISALEVAQHVKKEDLYMVIDGMVYNVTPFMNEHPGGEEVLLDLAGQDATEAFEDVGHSDEARDILKKLIVGKLQGKIQTNSSFESQKNLDSSSSKNHLTM